MHDPTEGGLATALHELAAACETGIRIDGTIDVMPECREICEALGLDPLGLLASGALVIVAAEADSPRVCTAIEAAGTPARRIGTLLSANEGVIMAVNGGSRPLPSFARDEVARFLSGEPKGAAGS
jgi:hydrogenase maturation factor